MIAPKSLSTKLQWQAVYNNFKVLCSNQQNITNNILTDITNLLKKLSINKGQDPLLKIQKRKLIYYEIGDYFTSSEAKSLFRPKDSKNVWKATS